MSAPTTAQDAALAALLTAESDVEAMRAEYDRRRRLIVDGLNALGLATFEPRGAFYAFPRIISTGLDDNAFVEQLINEEHVAAVPGSAFGPSGAGHVRMCYATSYDKLQEALVRITIEDNGPGIPPDQMENLFSPFLASTKSHGTGLGLPVSQKILTEHGGRILVHSEPGRGCRFTLELPAVLPQESSETVAGKEDRLIDS